MKLFSSQNLFKLFVILIVSTCYFVILSFFNVFNPKNTIQNIFTHLNNSIRNQPNTSEQSVDVIYEKEEDVNGDDVADKKMKYILMWTHNHTYPFIYLKSGQDAFIAEKCDYTNCFVTNNRQYLPDLTDWDAIIFHAPEFTWRHNPWNHGFPDKRSPRQKYVFTSIESADNYPSCDPRFNGYFNWTWTYKADADVKWGYIGIRDIETGKIIGPAVDINWKTNMDDVSEDFKTKLEKKTKAAAWFVSNCHTKSKREVFVKKLEDSLKKYDLSIDIYGRCGKLSCERDAEECWEKLKNDYFFYLSFENSFSEDYVTEKFLHAMKHGTVPIVWGGSNYSRFAPPGSYINAIEYDKNPDQLADLIHHLMNNINQYAGYFKWTKYYKYQRDIETPDTHAFCDMCKALNDKKMMETHSSYAEFNKWWNKGTSGC